MNFGISLNPLEAAGELINAGASVFNTMSVNKWAKKNYELQKQSQEEAMFMNRNQFQVQSSDAQKAGINPLAMQGGSISSASAQNVDAPQIDMSGINSILGTVLQAKNQKDLQKQFQEWKTEEDAKQRKHEEILASLKIDAENKRHAESLTQSQKQFDVNLDEIKRYHDQIKEIEDSKLSNEQKRIEIENKRYLLEQSSTDALNTLRSQQTALNKTELYSSCRALASEILTGYSKDKAGLFGLLERMTVKGINNFRRDTKAMTVDELADLLMRSLFNEQVR